MKKRHKCPALKHGVAITSITDKFFHGEVQPCCMIGNSAVSQSEFVKPYTQDQLFYHNEVLIPLGRPGYDKIEDWDDRFPGITSFDEIFTKHRDWVDDDGYINDTVCDWCVDRAATTEDNHLPYNDYTPAPGHEPQPQLLDTDSKKLVFLGPLNLESTCNFSCYVCGSGNSTQWASIVKPIKEDLENAKLTDDHQHIEKWYNSDHLSLNKTYSSKIKEVLYNTDMSSVQYVHLVGGEPLYGKMFPWFLELLDSRTDLSKVVFTFNTNISIFPNDKILNILRKFKEVRVSLSLDGIGPLQSTTRPGVSWEETNSNIEKWVDFRDTIHKHKTSPNGEFEQSVYLFFATTLSVLNVNKIGSLLDYAIEKNVIMPLTSDRTASGVEYDPVILTFVQFKPYLDINLIPVETRKNWLIDKNNYPPEYHFCIDEYNESILYDTNYDSTVDKCLLYLSIAEKATRTKFSDANPEMYNLLQSLRKNE